MMLDFSSFSNTALIMGSAFVQQNPVIAGSVLAGVVVAGLVTIIHIVKKGE